jgi:hypothetical protein
MSSPALRDETHGPSKKLLALGGPRGSTPAGSAGSVGGARSALRPRALRR